MFEPRPLGGGVADQNKPLPLCITMPNLVVYVKGCGQDIPPKLGRAGADPPFSTGECLTPYKFAPPHVGYYAEFDRCLSNGTSVRKGCTELLASRLSRSHKVTGTDTDRSCIYDF